MDDFADLKAGLSDAARKRFDELITDPIAELRERFKDMPPGAYVIEAEPPTPPIPLEEWTPEMRRIYRMLTGEDPKP